MCSTSPTCDSAHIPSHLPFASPYLQNSAGVWRQQILNSIPRKSKLGGEEIQPVTISVSMAFRGLAPLSPWKRISRCTTLTFSLPSHRDPSSSSDVLSSSQLSSVLPLLQRRYPCTLSARSSAYCLITLMLFFQSQTLTIWSCWVPTWQGKVKTDKQSNIMIEFRWWRWWIWWCNDLPWKEYNRKMNIKAHRLSPAQPTSMKLNPRTFAL